MEASESKIVRAEVRAYGRVQGVFYRNTLRRAALREGVVGSAFNRADGTVEAVFEGERDAVEARISVAREGPDGAYVERLDVAWHQPAGHTEFTVG